MPKVKIQWNRLGHLLHYAYFLMNSQREIQLATLEWFTEISCNTQQLKIINSFSKSRKSWKNTLEVPEKFQNLFGCELIFLIFDSSYHTSFDDANEPRGLLPSFTKAVGSVGNFSVKFQVYNENSKIESKGLSSHIAISLRSIIIMASPTCIDHMTSTFEDDPLVFGLTPGEKYSSYEKVLMPFDETSWFLLGITFVAGFVIIFAINQMPKFVGNLIYGEGIKDPGFNMIGSFFGISQFKLPIENFARILLTFFTLFCLVIRTGYQGQN
jgi:hypothetical protein